VKDLRELRPSVAAHPILRLDIILIAFAPPRQIRIENEIQEEPQVRMPHKLMMKKYLAPKTLSRAGSVAFVQLDVIDVPLIDDEVGSDLVTPLQELGEVAIDLAPGLCESSRRESWIHCPQLRQQLICVEQRLVLHALSPR
jgi:hypothetical protein